MVLVLLLLAVPFFSELAAADDVCGTHGEGATDGVLVESDCSTPGDSLNQAQGTPLPASAGGPAFVEYVWNSVCVPFAPGSPEYQGPDCRAAQRCLDPAERVWELWGRRPDPIAGWALLEEHCFGQPPTIVDAPTPEVTPGMVLEAIRRIGLPRLVARTQPAEKTLVNFATIFYAEPEPFTRSIRLLGRRVEVEATPTLFTWRHGDGTSASTGGPGGPYPSKEITYLYRDAHTTVRTSVDVTYTARFRVGGGAWRDIAETVTVVGPSSGLRISEATAVLSGQHE